MTDQAAELAAAQARIAELEAAQSGLHRSERVQSALYRIAETASAANDLDDFYAEIHEIVAGLMYGEHFYIALYDDEREMINFAYYRDSVDSDWPERGIWEPFGVGHARGLTAFVLRTGEPQHIPRERNLELLAAGEVEQIGVLGEDWLGVPLMSAGRALGVLAIQTYEPGQRYTPDDVQMLDYVGQHVATALTRAQAIDEVRQRNAELAVVNEIGSALVMQRDFQDVIEAVGDRAVKALGAGGLSICMVDPETNELTFLYLVSDGVRNREIEGVALGDPLSAEILSTGRPLRIGTAEEAAARGAPFAIGGTESYVGVPIPGRDRAFGVFALGTRERHAYSDADERLLSTLASSMGVALENARLVLAQTRSEEEFRRFVEGLPLAIYQDSPDNRSASIYASPKTEEIFGYPVGSWMQEGFFESVLHPDDRDRIEGEISVNLESSAGKVTLSYRVIAADGRTVWVRDDSWVARDEAGKPLYVQGFMMDVTEQTLAAAEIRRGKQYFEALVAISPVAIVTMGRDEIVSAWNPAATRLFGYEPDEAIGRGINDLLFLPDEREEGEAATRLADETGRAQLIGRRRRKDGGVVDVEIILVPLVVDGEHTGYYAIYHDITELQAARREADSANEAKSSFLAAMSHEIRTPMNGVIGMTGLLLDTPLNEEQRDYAENISISGEALLTIINDILDFSKIEAGRFELDSVPFDLPRTVSDVIDLIQPTAAKKGIDLDVAVVGSPVPKLLGDAGRIRQILLNLLSNAVKFTDHGQVNLRVETTPLDGRWQLRVSVQDTGVGIIPEGMSRLFQSFSQADASIAHRYGGTGLGLVISRRLAELMGGTLTATSSGIPGEGSRFDLAFVAEAAPAESALAQADDPAAERRAVTGSIGRPLRILLAEDNTMNQKLALRLLAKMGLTANLATNGLEAVAALELEAYDVILMDVQMPELDGLEATRRIRAAAPAHRPWIVAMTANAMEGDREACLAAGMDDYVSKPIRPDALAAALTAAEQGRPAEMPA
jgi:PAS domain S-box-containing protein